MNNAEAVNTFDQLVREMEHKNACGAIEVRFQNGQAETIRKVEQRGPRPTKTNAAMGWISEYLAAGPRRGNDVFKDGRVAGYTVETLRRAKKQLNVRMARFGVSSWWLEIGPSGEIRGQR